MEKKVIQYCFIFIFGTVVLLGLGNAVGYPKLGALSGAEVIPDWEHFSVEGWTNGEFQASTTEVFKKRFQFRPYLIRTHNELLYTLYSTTDTYVLLGQNNQLFAYDYFPAFRGFERKDSAYWNQNVEKLKWLQDTLATHHIPLLVVIAPNKVRYMPENLPEDLVKTPGDITDQSQLLYYAKEYGLNVLDLNTWFQSMKDTIQYPLMANTGIHWTGYGSILGFNEILQELTALSDTSFYYMELSEGRMYSDSVLLGDVDLADGLNLWRSLETQDLYYPEVEVIKDGNLCPDILFVSDSYLWNIINLGLSKELIDPDYSFWYYNKTNYDSTHGEVPVDSLNHWEEMLKRDAVVIMGTESNLKLIPYGLIENLEGALNESGAPHQTE